MERREFLKNSCTYCLGAMILGVAVTELSSCAGSLPIYKTQMKQDIVVPTGSFAQNNMVIVRPSESEYDILLIKKSESNYIALLMKCTHRDNPLNATKTGLYCPAHGSRFDLDGNVTQQPATQPLKHYKTILNQASVTILTNS